MAAPFDKTDSAEAIADCLAKMFIDVGLTHGQTLGVLQCLGAKLAAPAAKPKPKAAAALPAKKEALEAKAKAPKAATDRPRS